jgi:nicotinate-nucleotide--dimethylbenzimidazole phosphoribosyltransferase
MSERAFEAAVATVVPVDEAAMAAAREHHDRLTKPRGALGYLEDLGVRLCGISGTVPPPVPAPAVVAVFAGDHGVVAQGVTPWPSEVTRQMVANFCAGGAAINVLARQAGARVVVVDIGVAGDLEPAPALLARKVRGGTGDIAVEPAMTRDEAGAALDVGVEVARRLIADGARCLLTGDMGIGNTTPSAAGIARLTGRAPAEVTGRGTGVDDGTWSRKVEVVNAALERTADLVADGDTVGAAASLGGLEILGLAGLILGGAEARVPVIVDGVIAAAGLGVAAALCPAAAGYCFAGHLSSEPGAGALLDFVGLRPVLDLGLRLGEGTGACLALPVLQAAARIIGEMATFDSAGVTEKDG